MTRRTLRACLLVLALGMTGVPAALADTAAAGITVSDNQLLDDGRPFLPRGFNMIGLLAPDWCTKTASVNARNNFGQAELDAAKAWHANTLRFQVSQRGLADPSLSQADRDAYLQKVRDGVALARANGFVVVLSMQDQALGCGLAHPLPSGQTVDAWTALAPSFSADPYVLFELFNEPQNTADAAGWAQWQSGGPGPSANLGDLAVGHQALMDQLRALSVPNVLVADVAQRAEQSAGLPLLSDPTDKLAYAVHPYNFTGGATWWDTQYGGLAAVAPVIATEWNYTADGCVTMKEQLAPGLLTYLRAHGIGVLGHAFDTPGSTIANFTWTPTACGTAVGGSGAVLQASFAAQADADSPPTAPTGLQTAGLEPAQVGLTWNPSTDDVGVAGYDVLRDGLVLTRTTTTSYTDSTVSPAGQYVYTVQAVDAGGGRSPTSDPLTVTTPGLPPPDVTAPSVPVGLASPQQTTTSISMTWTPSTDDSGVSGYQVLRDGTVVGTAPATATPGYTDTGLGPATQYSYTVTAVDTSQNLSAPADPLTVAILADTTPPTGPSLLTARVVSPTQVALSWPAATDDIGVVGYQVFRDNTLVTTRTATSWNDTAATAGPHTYGVRAVDAAGNPSPSVFASVTVPAAAPRGLTGTYFDTAILTTPKLTRVDPTVNFAWGTGSPAASIGPDTFSARWTGRVIVPAAGSWTFITQSDNGVRLWIDGVQVINNWTAHPLTTNKAAVTLTADRAHDVRLEYYEQTGSATMKLLWTGPGVAQQVIPAAQLLAR